MSKLPQMETIGQRHDQLAGRWQDWFNLILGAWLIIAPFVGVGTGTAAGNSYIAGAAVAIFAVVAIARPQAWEEWVNLVLGLWLVIAPFVLGFTEQASAMWNHIVVGILVAADSLWAALQGSGRRAHA